MRQVFIKFSLEGLENINTNAAAIFVLAVDSVDVVTTYFNFAVRDRIIKPRLRDGKNVELICQDSLFHKDVVMPAFERAYVEMSYLNIAAVCRFGELLC